MKKTERKELNSLSYLNIVNAVKSITIHYENIHISLEWKYQGKSTGFGKRTLLERKLYKVQFQVINDVAVNTVAYCPKAGLYLNRSGRPLLGNGLVFRFSVSLSGSQTRSHDNAYIGRLFPM
jgi:hypothetical protein